MYESYWQIEHKPFESGADPRFYYPGESHQAALLKLRYAVESRRSGAVLAGPSGIGKTLLVTILKTMLAESFSPVVHLVFPQLTTSELLAYLAAELTGIDPQSASMPAQESVRRIEHFLAANAARGQHAVVVIDESHLLGGPQTLETLRLLLNFQAAGQPCLTLLLVGQTSFLPLLDRMPQLEERLAVKCLLRSFKPQETAQYAQHRVHVAGGQPTLFEPQALSVLHDLTQGIPRRINRLCDLALLIGYAENRTTLDAATLQAVSEELVMVVPD